MSYQKKKTKHKLELSPYISLLPPDTKNMFGITRKIANNMRNEGLKFQTKGINVHINLNKDFSIFLSPPSLENNWKYVFLIIISLSGPIICSRLITEQTRLRMFICKVKYCERKIK